MISILFADFYSITKYSNGGSERANTSKIKSIDIWFSFIKGPNFLMTYDRFC